MTFSRFLGTLAFATILRAQAEPGSIRKSAPSFENFHASSARDSKLVAPRFKEGLWPYDDPKFREAVIAEAASGPNFAGKLSIVKVGCGTGCMYIAVLDQETGAISVDMPFYSLLVGPFSSNNNGNKTFSGLSYRIDSRLMVAEGCFDSTDGRKKGRCSTDYFVWSGKRFILLKRIPIDTR
ncbi:MAG: hypothetical protein ABJF23_34565 [Bryobacteraceae bacterium]